MKSLFYKLYQSTCATCPYSITHVPIAKELTAAVQARLAEVQRELETKGESYLCGVIAGLRAEIADLKQKKAENENGE